MSADSASQVLSGLLTNDIELIDELSRLLAEDCFTDPTHKNLYQLIRTYRTIANGVLTKDAVAQSVSNAADTGSAALLRESFDALVATPVTPDVARWQVAQLRTAREKRMTVAVLRDAGDILNGTVTEEGFNGQPGRVWSGPSDARKWLSERVSEIDSEVSVVDAPAADVLYEGRPILEDFLKAKKEDKSRIPHMGIPAFDDLYGGLGKGLIMIAAPSGLGKTQACVSIAYQASELQHLNVFFATSETVRTTVRARLVARHSRHEKFAELREELGLPTGLNSKDIDRGSLRDEHIGFLGQVAKDWGATGSRDSEGSCFVAQMPFGMTWPALKSQIETRSRAAKPDLVIVDYVALMSASRRLHSKREELSMLVQEAAHFSVDFDKGNGVPTISPWQLNRESQKEMIRTGDLETSGLAETAESVNSAHMIVTLSPDGNRDRRSAGLRLNVLKCRDGEVLTGDNGISIIVDYASSYFEQRVAVDSGDFGNNGSLSDEDASLLFS